MSGNYASNHPLLCIVLVMAWVSMCVHVCVQSDKNQERLKEWLASADTNHITDKEEEPTVGGDMDDLGTLSDYEFGKSMPHTHTHQASNLKTRKNYTYIIILIYVPYMYVSAPPN